MEELIIILEKYGAWALVGFLGFGFCRLLLEFRKAQKEKDDIIEKMGKEQSTEMVAVVRECTAILTTVSDFLDRYERSFIQHSVDMEMELKKKKENRNNG
jgi:hypothetical protein